MSAIEDLQDWYLSQCNDDWEHVYGMDIETLDNPGWSFRVDLTDTNLEGVRFEEYSYGDAEESEDWVNCKVKDRKFVGTGGPKKLEEIINVFVSWAKSNT
jgi:hypothetical protein